MRNFHIDSHSDLVHFIVSATVDTGSNLFTDSQSATCSLFFILIIAIVTGVKWFPRCVFTYISFLVSNVKYFPTCVVHLHALFGYATLISLLLMLIVVSRPP